jgi:hypothetical protein
MFHAIDMVASMLFMAALVIAVATSPSGTDVTLLVILLIINLFFSCFFASQVPEGVFTKKAKTKAD